MELGPLEKTDTVRPGNEEGVCTTNGDASKRNGESKTTRRSISRTNNISSKEDGAANTSVLTPKEPELSNAERKKRQKAEKTAKRAQAKGVAQTTTDTESAVTEKIGVAAPARKDSWATEQQWTRKTSIPKQVVRDAPGQDDTTHALRTASTSTKDEKTVPLRRRLSQSATQDQPRLEKPKQEKQVSFFAHLYNQPRRPTLEGASKDVHPAILTLAIQLRSYTICGSHARCVAMLLALKSVYALFPQNLMSFHLAPRATTS